MRAPPSDRVSHGYSWLFTLLFLYYYTLLLRSTTLLTLQVVRIDERGKGLTSRAQ